MNTLEKLKNIKIQLDEVISELDTTGSSTPVYALKPLPENAVVPYTGCWALWNAAQADFNLGKGWLRKDGTPFAIFDYIPGLQRAGVTRVPPKSPQQMQEDIKDLGFTPQGREWLSKDENSSMLDRDYQRFYNGYVAVRKNVNDPTQGFDRIP